MISGGDRITARELHKNPVSFMPTHHVWFSGNHKPLVRGTDAGIWRRLRLVPFHASFNAEQQDHGLTARLEAVAPGSCGGRSRVASNGRRPALSSAAAPLSTMAHPSTRNRWTASARSSLIT